MDVICRASRVVTGIIVAVSIVAAVGTNAANAQQTSERQLIPCQPKPIAAGKSRRRIAIIERG